MNITKFMLSKCKEMDIKQNPRISVSYKGYMDNYIIGHLLRLGDQKDRCRVTFKLRSQGKTEVAMQRWRKRVPGKGNQGFQGRRASPSCTAHRKVCQQKGFPFFP